MSVNRFNRFLSGFRRVFTESSIRIVICAAGAGVTQAATLTWDGNGATAPNPNGGAGTWDANTTANWWDGAGNVVWPAPGGTDDDAVFANTAGTVTVAAGGVTVNDLTFSTTGYIVQTGTVTLNGTSSVITTDAGVTATINSVLPGSTNVTKAGDGILVLGATNTRTGKWTVNGGVLSINADTRLGAVPGAATADYLTLSGGTLRLSAGNQTIAANRGITLGAGGGTLDSDALADTSNLSTTISGIISGTGPLVIQANGNFSATGGGSNTLGIRLASTANTFTGDVTVSTGFVNYAGNGSFGNAANKIILNGGGILDSSAGAALSRNIEVLSGGGTFRAYGSTNTTWSGTLSGSGNINRTDGGTITLSGDLSGYTGTYNNQGGNTTLTGTTATIGGNWALAAGTVTVNSTANQTLAGTISGAGALAKNGSGKLKLTNGNTTFTGATAVTAGTLELGHNSAAGTGAVTVASGGKILLTAGSGLNESSLSTGALNTTAVNTSTIATNGTPKANTNAGWTASQQWTYTGYIKVGGASDVTWTFGANIDDATHLTVDGNTVINNGVYNTADVGTVTNGT